MSELTPSADEGAAILRPTQSIPLVLPPACFTHLSSILKAVPLRFPVTFADRNWTAIHIRRLSVAQIAAIMDNYRANLAIDPDAQIEMPIYVDDAGHAIPDGLLEALDADDSEDVGREGANFLPRRFRARSAPPGSGPNNGEATSPSPPAPSGAPAPNA